MPLRIQPDDLLLLKQLGRQHPRLVDLLTDARQAEMETMAQTSAEHFCTFKGRVQALTELRQLIQS
jgi:hypothetical protein